MNQDLERRTKPMLAVVGPAKEIRGLLQVVAPRGRYQALTA